MQERNMQERNSRPPSVHDTATAPSDLLNLHEIVAKARQNLNQNDWDYIVGGVESETTLRRNRMALDTIAFRPRVLRDVSKVDASVSQLGRTLRLPVVLAPVGSLESFHPAGAESVVRAVDAFGAAHMLSSVCDPGLEDLAAAAPNALRLFQLYARGDEAWVDDHVERAIAHGYAAFCLTVDTAHYSRRERDIAKRFVTAGRRRVQGRAFQAALDWRTVKRIKSRFKIPLAIKGIATAEAAASSITAAAPWTCCRRSWPPWTAAPRSSSTDRSAAAPTSSRRSPPAPIWSASAACSALRSPPAGRPAWCGCSSCWRTRCSVVSACSASASLPNSTAPICMPRRPRTRRMS